MICEDEVRWTIAFAAFWVETSVSLMSRFHGYQVPWYQPRTYTFALLYVV